ncbi:MAG: hypothetical protein LBF16_07260, partial [Pseudomonadales bacterium]|nr:hypothetical protein [Pseudomonadales bacterium]
MATSQIVWTVLPYGMSKEQRRISVVVSPRLTPQSKAEQMLGGTPVAFPEFINWPKTLQGTQFSLEGEPGGGVVALNLVSSPDGNLWTKFFNPETPVTGFEFQDMSTVNLHSFSVRNVLSYLKRNYGKLALQSGTEHPTLLPWSGAQGDLRQMLEEVGTKTDTLNFGPGKVEYFDPQKRFDRFFASGFDDQMRKDAFSGAYKVGVPAASVTEPAGTPSIAQQAPRRALSQEWSATDPALQGKFQTADEYALYQADRFYRRARPTDAERALRRPQFNQKQQPKEAPVIDFHQIIAALASYPELMRRLGLVLDFTINDDRWFQKGIAGGIMTGRIRLVMKWGGKDHVPSTDITPWTAFYADKERFITRPLGADQLRGLLRLEGADDQHGEGKNKLFDVYQLDADGSALKTVDFALTTQNLVAKQYGVQEHNGQFVVQQPHGEVTYSTGDKQPVAALRNGGLSVSRHGRAVDAVQRVLAAAVKNAAFKNKAEVTLFAEDVHRGYRVDVATVPDASKAGPWRTLCARHGTYTLEAKLAKNEKPPEFADDEGWVSGLSTSSGGPGSANPDDHYLHEALFGWSGWSLVAPPAGRSIKAQPVAGTELQGEAPSDALEEPASGVGIKATFTPPPRSLPRLRFGQLYRFRARIVDLAGNSLDVDDVTLGE